MIEKNNENRYNLKPFMEKFSNIINHDFFALNIQVTTFYVNILQNIYEKLDVSIYEDQHEKIEKIFASH